jgi:hypothetical protein
MKWTLGHPTFLKIFGECLETVYRGRHLVMTSEGRDYVIQESATRKVICRYPQKGMCYRYLKSSYSPR